MQLAPLSKNIPQVGWDGVRVSFVPHQVERLKEAGLMDLAREMSAQGRVSSDELAAEPGRFLICTRGSRGATKLFDKVGSGQRRPRLVDVERLLEARVGAPCANGPSTAE